MVEKNWIKRNWNYIAAFIIPWIIILLHSLIRRSWLTGEGSILSGDSGSVYYELYAELWNKLHNGGSLAFSWNAGTGIDFLVQIFNYLISPFTILILLLPFAWIENMLEFVMVLKWSLISLTAVYYFKNTEQNDIPKHNNLISLVLGLAFSLSNVIISDIAYVSWLDVIVLFPLLALWTEQAAVGRLRKRFVLCMIAGFLMNWRMMIPVCVFLVIWYFIHIDTSKNNKKDIIRYISSIVAAVLSGGVVMLPSYMAERGNILLYNNMSVNAFIKQNIMPVFDVITRFFIVDSLLESEKNEPMLYCSVALLSVATMFVFTSVSKSKKISVIVLVFMLIAGLTTGFFNIIWHGYIGMNEQTASFAFILIFVIVYMAMRVVCDIQLIRLRYQIAAVGVAFFFVVIAFLHIDEYNFLEFYVYLSTILISAFVILMSIFCRKKSIKYENYLIILAIITIAELGVNSYYQLRNYNNYKIGECYYNNQSIELAGDLEINRGQRVAMTQTEVNYGMTMNCPTVNGGFSFENGKVINVARQLGLAVQGDSCYLMGNSPLVNSMYNASYTLSSSDVAVADSEQIDDEHGYRAYKNNNMLGLGYMVSENVVDWDYSSDSPFEVQNDFIKKTTGGQPIFELTTPFLKCDSLLGGIRYDQDVVLTDREHRHNAEEKNKVCPYDSSTRFFYYNFKKMFEGDVVNASWESDGTTDYYVFLKTSAPAYHDVSIGDSNIFVDYVPTEQKMLHIGVVDEGKIIQIQSNVLVDDIAEATIDYQFASYKQTHYEPIYDAMKQSVMDIRRMDDNRIEGAVTADSNGILYTSVPAYKGFDVLVDGDKVDTVTIGGAFIGVPLSKGDHEIVFEYRTPYMISGLLMSLVGICITCFMLYLKTWL